MLLYTGTAKIARTLSWVRFYLLASIGGELPVGVSTWQIKTNLGRYRRVLVEEIFSIIPAERLLQAMIFTPTELGSIATVIMPAL